MIYTWKDIIKENSESINLVGYGSLLNKNSNSYDSSLLPVIIKWFKRTYNIKMIPDNYSQDRLNNFKKYLIKYWIRNDDEIKRLNKENLCVLNCIYTWNSNDLVNWLLLKINREQLFEFSQREAQYNLIKTKFKSINPESGEYTWKFGDAYILTAKPEQIISEWKAFQAYHENAKKWAYSFWNYFWEAFEKSIL